MLQLQDYVHNFVSINNKLKICIYVSDTTTYLTFPSAIKQLSQ